MILLPEDLLRRYLANPLATDPEVRRFAKIPETDYFVVSVWPTPGWVDVDRPNRRTP